MTLELIVWFQANVTEVGEQDNEATTSFVKIRSWIEERAINAPKACCKNAHVV